MNLRVLKNYQLINPKDMVENKSILIADDDDEIRNLLISAFKDEFTVYTANNGRVCIQLALSKMPDVILSDINMPLVDGFDIVSQLATDTRTNHIPIIIMTGYNDTKAHAKALSIGAIDYITKPFEIEFLIKKIANIVDKQRNLITHKSLAHLETTKANLLNKKDNAFFEKVTQIVSENYQDSRFSVELLKNSLNITERQLQRQFKKVFQLTPTTFIKRYRLNKAKEMLLNGYSIAETYESVGFNSQSYFSHSFKEHFGKSPKHCLVE